MLSSYYFPRKSNRHSKKKLSIIIFTLLVASLACSFPAFEEAVPEHCSPEFLIAAMSGAAAGAGRVPVTIDLAPGCVYILTEVNNHESGVNALPSVINEVIIIGNGATIRREPTDGTNRYRFFHIAEGGILRLSDLTIENGYETTSESGGAVLVGIGGQLFVEDTLFQENTSRYGGAIASLRESMVTIATSQFIGNIVDLSGGALHLLGPAVITDSSFTNNTAGDLVSGAGTFRGFGGAVYFAGNAALEITGSTFENNQAAFSGGAISTVEGTATFTNSTFSANSADNGGAVSSSASIILNFVTVVNNNADEGGGIFVDSAGSDSFVIKNSIIAGNSADNCAIRSGTFTARNANLANDTSCPGFTITADPAIEPLADNGGPTMTHALMSSSPAIDAATGECAIMTDQRGALRPFPPGGDCDLGAYEFGEMVPTSGEVDDLEIMTVTPTTSTTSSTATMTPTPQPPISNTQTLCWGGPGSAYDTISSIQPGTTLTLLGIGAEDGWLVIDNPVYQGVTCWLPKVDVDLDSNLDINSLKVFPVPPLPTATFTPVPTATFTPVPNTPTPVSPTAPVVTAPQDPSGMAANETACNTTDGYVVKLTWNDNADNEDGYRVYRNGNLIATLGANTTQYTDKPPGSGPYTYYVEAFNNTGSAKSNSAQEDGCIY